MGKILNFVMSKDWEEFQRVELYKKLGNKLEDLSPEKLEKIKELLSEE